MEESESNDNQRTTDECVKGGYNRLVTEMRDDSEESLPSSDKIESLESLENMKNREEPSPTSAELKAASTLDREKSLLRDEDPDEDEGKGSDEDYTNKEKTGDEKRDDESSTSSTSTSDDESETSSEEKTETSKPETDEAATSFDKQTDNKPKKEETAKIEDTTDDSDIDDDLVSTINYNTITSLAALKDMLQSSGEDSDGVDSFFHHYFLSHVNRLPSRNQTHSPYPWGRRLSECREEDEYETEEGQFH